MKVLTYMCENCLEPHVFSPLDKNSEYICPECGEKMMYFGTEEIDPNTKKVINRYDEAERKQANPGKPVVEKPTITCPYCHSTNTKKISNLSKAGSVALFGIFALGKASKQFHCNECSADF